MKVHLIDGTYELFRAYFGAPPASSTNGREVGATRGLIRSIGAMVRQADVTHVACAFDHVIESFRNDLFYGYKTGEGIEPELKEQFPLAEDAMRALGIVVWPMVDFEADDAIATAAARFSQIDRVEQVVICSPDKDMAQCVRGNRIVTWDRMREKQLDENGVVHKFGVAPTSIPDYLALVGDAADGIPGIPRWGAKSSSAILARYKTIEGIPDDPEQWSVKVRGAGALCANLANMRQDALLFKKLATLREDVPIPESLDDLEWRGADRQKLTDFCEFIGEPGLVPRMFA